MGKTFDQSLIDTARIPMSLIDPDDMKDTKSEEFLGLRRVQQGCHNELTNRQDYPFNKSFKTIKTRLNKSDYSPITGTIYKVWIGNSETGQLKYEKDVEKFGDSKGKPSYFSFTYNPDRLLLYPIPDKEYVVNITYDNTLNVLQPDGSMSNIITEGSKLIMPEWIQPYYFDALEYYVLYENLRKLSNPRFEPTLKIFNDKWQIFLDKSQSTDADTYFVI